MVRVAAITLIAAFIAFPLAAQNLLVNPGFDDADQLTGWTCITAYGLPSWSTQDRLNSGTSGSMQHDVIAATINRSVSCSQCLPVTELHDYEASMWHYWPNDVDVTQDGSTRLSVAYYSDSSCVTFLEWGPLAIHGYPPYSLDTWILLEGGRSTAPIGAAAARLNVMSWQDLANEPIRSRIDDVDFHSTTIFRDGFESGDTIAWEP